MPIAVRHRPPRPDFMDQTFRAAAHVTSTREADATVLLDSRRGLCYSLNELGWRIWEQVGAGERVADVVQTLRQEYDLPPENFEADVAAFIDQLLRSALIEPAER